MQIQAELDRFHREREVFRTSGIRSEGFSLPRQHSLKHYSHGIQEFGALNGLCSSITESAHIRAVKKPYRRSNRHNALGQMLLTNQRLDKLAAARVDFTSRGMLLGPCIPLLSLIDDTDPPPDELSSASSITDEEGLNGAESGPVDGNAIQAEVVLSRRSGV